jgi:hypothetical protein
MNVMGDQNRNQPSSQSAGQREPNQPPTQANDPSRKTPMRDNENRQQPTGQREEGEEE